MGQLRSRAYGRRATVGAAIVAVLLTIALPTLADDASSGNSVPLADGPLTFVRAGIARRLELGIAPPGRQSRAITGNAPFDAARGTADLVLAAKYLILDTGVTQRSLGAAYAPPTGTGEFTAALAHDEPGVRYCHRL